MLAGNHKFGIECNLLRHSVDTRLGGIRLATAAHESLLLWETMQRQGMETCAKSRRDMSRAYTVGG